MIFILNSRRATLRRLPSDVKQRETAVAGICRRGAWRKMRLRSPGMLLGRITGETQRPGLWIRDSSAASGASELHSRPWTERNRSGILRADTIHSLADVGETCNDTIWFSETSRLHGRVAILLLMSKCPDLEPISPPGLQGHS